LMIKLLRRKAAMVLFWLSSVLKACGKLMMSNRTIVCDCLSLPGWFILDECIIHQTAVSGKLIGFEWTYWPMPELWIIELNKLKRKL